VAAQLRSNWIEVVAVPIASAIMETQPIALGLLLLVPNVFGTGSAYPDAASITFLLLFLHWWSMGTMYVFERRGASPGIFTFYDILGILVALVALTVTHLAVIADPAFLFVALAVTGWSWKRGADRARAGLNEGQMINAFKIGFITLLFVLVFALLALFAHMSDLANALLLGLPIFFLVGMITLSFTRIGIVKKEQARQAMGKRREKMGSWLAALTTTWIILVAGSIALEALPLETIKELLSPLWYVLGLLALGIAYVLDFLATLSSNLLVLIIALMVLLFHSQSNQPGAPAIQQAQATHASQDSGTLLFILRILLIVVIIIATILITRFLQKRRRGGPDDAPDEEEEVREGLDRNQILRARREGRRQRQQALPLAALDSDSMRARYRDFLAAMAARGEDFTRRPQETPAEYQRRILHAARNIPASGDSETPVDSTILETLTRAYSLERYGDRQAHEEQSTFLRRWMPHLVQRFSEHFTSKPKPTSIQKTMIQSRWGED